MVETPWGHAAASGEATMIIPRVLYVITRSNLGGAQTNVLDLLTGFQARYDVRLATGEEGPLTDRARSLGVPVYLLPNLVRRINPLADLAAVRECATLIRQVKPHLLHAHSSKAGIIARLAGRRIGVPVVFTAHGWGFNSGTPPFRRIMALIAEKMAAPMAARIICVSDHDRQLALHLGVGNEHTLATVRYGIHPDTPGVADPTVQPPRFIMVARFNEQKDQDTLLRALARVRRDNAAKVQLDFAGSGPSLEKCQALARMLGVADHVSFLGDRHDVPNLLARSQGFVLSTHYEGLPISIMEAMRAGLPVVATDVSGIAEEVSEGQTGLLVPHRNVEALASALLTLLGSPELRRDMGEAGRHKFLEEFTVEHMLNRMDAVYQAITKPTRWE